jgi:hypothetical protein
MSNINYIKAKYDNLNDIPEKDGQIIVCKDKPVIMYDVASPSGG